MPTGYLTFNSTLEGHYQNHDQPTNVDVSKDLRLKYKWVLWEQMSADNYTNKGQNYSDATHKVETLSTVKEFWKYWNHLPQPSQLLQNKKFVRIGDDGSSNVVDAIMIFKDGIKPEWEDKINATGGNFTFVLKQTMDKGQVDEYWNNLVLGLIGSTIEPMDMITGIRLVDKLAQTRIPSIRIEVWFSRYDESGAVDALQLGVEKCMCTKLDGSLGVKEWTRMDKKKHDVAGKH